MLRYLQVIHEVFPPCSECPGLFTLKVRSCGMVKALIFNKTYEGDVVTRLDWLPHNVSKPMPGALVKALLHFSQTARRMAGPLSMNRLENRKGGDLSRKDKTGPFHKKVLVGNSVMSLHVRAHRAFMSVPTHGVKDWAGRRNRRCWGGAFTPGFHSAILSPRAPVQAPADYVARLTNSICFLLGKTSVCCDSSEERCGVKT